MFSAIVISKRWYIQSNPPPENISQFQPQYTYPNPVSHNERFQNIQDFFDQLIINSPESQYKKQLLNYLKESWIKAQVSTQKLRWLERKEKDATSWTLNYINDYNQKNSSQNNQLFSSNPIPIPNYLISEEEQNIGINTALQMWSVHSDIKQMFYQRITKAWNQRKLRRTREDMKAVNTYISIEAKEKLDKLAKFNRARMNEMLERLIEDEYDKQRLEIDRKYRK